ncbi:hypothetical protein POKO110462_20205 [Pontibacter korlensis]|uniref:Uncharacterized protein n=1 Tax=Pontibacter korlensis TaxID=400092 RepID=A0A0E3ZI23_9BACT|nr:hypothetical protein [Pontibacter korlensis]AKD04380.1 hypothetical protein PKOR_16410 [Pontibacter korlensis]
MIEWSFIERVIIGDLRPHLVEENSAKMDEILNRIKLNKVKCSLNNLIDIEYPSPYNLKTRAYYELIKSESEIIRNDIQRFSIRVSGVEDLQFLVKNQIRYALKLLEDAETYRRESFENFDEVYINDNAYASGSIHRYFDIVVEELLNFYADVAPEEYSLAYHVPKRIKLIEANNKLNIFISNRRVNSTELFLPNLDSREHEFIMKLYSFFTESGFINSSYPLFERHFINTKEGFSQLIWKKGIPLLKHVFLLLIHNKLLKEPRTNLDSLLSQHFVNKQGNSISENYLSQATSRLYGNSPQLIHLNEKFESIISHFSSNII